MSQFEEVFYYIRKPWVIALYAALVIISYYCIDQPVAIYFHQLQLRENAYVLSIFTGLGISTIYILLFFISGLFFRYVKANPVFEQKSWYLFGCILLATFVCGIVKVTLARARPDLLFSINAYGFYGFSIKTLYNSMPSGHSVTVAAVAAGLGVIFRKYFFTLVLLALLVALSRLVLYKHYLSDIMVGFYLSLLVVDLFTLYLKKNRLLNKAWVNDHG